MSTPTPKAAGLVASALIILAAASWLGVAMNTAIALLSTKV